MFTQLAIYKNMIMAGIVGIFVIGLYFYIHGLNKNIEALKKSLLQNQVKLANSKLESTRYKAALDSQNKEIERLKVQENIAEVKLKKWKSKPPDVKYKVIYKVREVKSDDCKDIKNVINSVRHIDYNSL